MCSANYELSRQNLVRLGFIQAQFLSYADLGARQLTVRFAPGPLTAVLALLAVGAIVAGCVGTVAGDVPSIPGPVSPAETGEKKPDQRTPEGPAVSVVARPPVRRLGPREYTRAVGALLGVPDGTISEDDLPTDASTTGFSNSAELQAMSPLHVYKYGAAAHAAVSVAMSTPQRRLATVGCDPQASPPCVEQFLTRFGLLAFRRPLTSIELDELVNAAHAESTSTDTGAGLAVVLEAMLQSPSFLFRAELGLAIPGRPGVRRLTGYEMATRLAFLIWQSGPDAPLVELARTGALDSPDGVAAAAARLLGDRRGGATLRTFFSEWFDLDQLPTLERPTKDFPRWSKTAAQSMNEELLRVLDDHLAPGARFIDAFTAPYTYVDARLAAIEGLPVPPGSTFVRTALDAKSERAGVLTMPALLALNAKTHGSSAIQRGAFLRRWILCQELPAPPDEVPALPKAQAGQSERQRLEQHRSAPACSGCHTLLDPLGFGLDHFDAIGAWRATDEQGQPISDAGEMIGAEPPAFKGALELGTKVRALPGTTACVARQLYRFAFGRQESDQEAPALAALATAFAAGGDFRQLVLQLVRSDAFGSIPAP